MRTFASLFTGGGIADTGYKMAGLQHLWGIEKNPEIAAANYKNSIHTLCGDVLDYRSYKVETPDLLHISPPCIHFTCGHKPTEQDISISKAIVQWIRNLEPSVIVIEQVTQYFKHPCFGYILTKLLDMEYYYQPLNLNFSDYGVPQNRKRGIAIFTQTHCKIQLKKTNNQGWYKAIKHISLPRKELCQWQTKLLRDQTFPCPVLIERQGNSGDRLNIAYAHEPSFTIRASLADNGSSSFHNVIMPDGKTYALNAQALAALQTIPETYKLPDNNKIAVRIIGNGVPCAITKSIGEALCQNLSLNPCNIKMPATLFG